VEVMTRLVNISEAVSLGLHTMTLLATNAGHRLSNRHIADTLNASGHHLAKVMRRLVKAGLVDSVSGPQGGFLLSRPAEDITLLTIYEAIDGTIDEEECLLGEPICSGRNCLLGEVLHSIHAQLRDYLSNTTLAELAKSVFLDGPPWDATVCDTTACDATE
jgi:Rrf2 family protein